LNQVISTHSPRMGRDMIVTSAPPWASHFNPLSPHGERQQSLVPFCAPWDFNPLSPHGERLANIQFQIFVASFQPTLPAWGETHKAHYTRKRHRFQPTLPAWGETRPGRPCSGSMTISTHSPRMGRDTAGLCAPPIFEDISTHSPRMGRDEGRRA